MNCLSARPCRKDGGMTLEQCRGGDNNWDEASGNGGNQCPPSSNYSKDESENPSARKQFYEQNHFPAPQRPQAKWTAIRSRRKTRRRKINRNTSTSLERRISSTVAQRRYPTIGSTKPAISFLVASAVVAQRCILEREQARSVDGSCVKESMDVPQADVLSEESWQDQVPSPGHEPHDVPEEEVEARVSAVLPAAAGFA